MSEKNFEKKVRERFFFIGGDSEMRIRDFGKLIEFGSPQHQQKLTPTQTGYT
jgi:hypothetical protein